MSISKSSFSGLLALLLSIDPALARAPDKAETVIAAAKKATGGFAWDMLQGSYEEGTHGGTPYKTWLDFRHYGMRMDVGDGASLRTRAYNGSVAWQASAQGTRSTQDAAALVEARTTAYLSANGFFFPSRFKAKTAYVRLATEGARSFDIVTATPEGGRALELWVDRTSHLLTRVVDHQDQSAMTVTASDFRRVGKVLIAFHFTVSGDSGQVLDEAQVAKVELRSVERGVFEPIGVDK